MLSILLTYASVAGIGCSSYLDPNVPEPIRPHTDPRLNREYLLYRPSSYDAQKSWPLIVLCHSGFPDSANKSLRDWTPLAEEYGFIVVAPEMTGTTGPLSRDDDKARRKQRADEECILSAVQHVQAGQNVSPDRILIHGSGGGAVSALRTGLLHADIFRAIALTQPRFEPEQLADAAALLAPWQPILLNYRGSNVVTGKPGRECEDWLRMHGGDVRIEKFGPIADTYARRAVGFFQEVLRSMPWMHVRAAPAEGGDPLNVRFRLLTHAPPSRFRWRFGEGDESPVAEPVHMFTKPGTHRVEVTAEWPKLGEHTRIVDLELPACTVRPAHGP